LRDGWFIVSDPVDDIGWHHSRRDCTFCNGVQQVEAPAERLAISASAATRTSFGAEPAESPPQ
jgi:hypothetical protein